MAGDDESIPTPHGAGIGRMAAADYDRTGAHGAAPGGTMKSLVRQFFSASAPRSGEALLEELQLALDLSPAEATLVIATLLADGVIERAGAPAGALAPGDWLAPGPRFAALSSADP
jgi:hypothetical protein